MLSLKGIVLETVTTECRRITRKNVCQCNIQDRGFNSPENDTMNLSDKGTKWDGYEARTRIYRFPLENMASKFESKKLS